MSRSACIWRTICQSLRLSEEVTEKWWRAVSEKYQEPQRCYHTMTHIDEMLKLMEEYKEFITDHNAVAHSIIFHDVIYDPKAPDNEEKSADFFKEFATEAKLEPDFVEVVRRHILETKAHTTPAHREDNPSNITDLHYLLDFDMAVLSWPHNEYDKYAEQIRQEYIHVPDEEFNKRRAEVLRTFSKIAHIYATPEFRKKCEGPARENLEREITRLTDK